MVAVIMLAPVCAFSQAVPSGSGTETDPYIVDYDGNGYHQWGSGSYGTAGTTTYFKLAHDVYISTDQNTGTYETMNVNAGTVVLDLNGYELRLIPTSDYTNPTMFKVAVGATLIIKSSGDNGAQGKIVGRGTGASLQAFDVSGVLEMETASIVSFKHAVSTQTSCLGGAVLINNGGVFNMRSGSIMYCGVDRTAHYNADYSLNTNAVPHHGGAVYVTAGGLFNFSGGTIAHCESHTGGAIYVGAIADYDLAYPSLVMSDSARIENCTASYMGGGIYVNATATGRSKFMMSGGTITGCRTNTFGCGVYSRGIMEMSGGLITGNMPDWYAAGTTPDYSQAVMTPNEWYIHPLGGGVCTEGMSEDKKSELIMTGGIMSNNVSASGGAIMSYKNSSLTISNEATLEGNHAIGSQGTGNGGGIYIQSSDFTLGGGIIRGNSARRYGGGINVNAATGNAATVTLTGNCVIEDNFAGHGGGISQEAGECTMNINSSNVRITGNTARGVAAPFVEGTGFKDSTAFECYGTGGNGGGIFVEKGTVNISNGLIEGNNAGADGGGISLRGVRVQGSIDLNMTGGSVSNNNTDNPVDNIPGAGGGISIYAVGQSAGWMSVNASIASGSIVGNKANNGAGIDIYTDANCSALLKIGDGNPAIPPVIKSNEAAVNGGGVFLAAGNIQMFSGDISQNTAVSGAGICLEKGSIEISGNNSYVQNNVAAEYGGGLYVVNDNAGTQEEVSFTGGIFSGNSANDGGGVCVEGNIKLNAQNMVLRANIANNGGGVYMLKNGYGAPQMVYKGGLISNNLASGTLKSTLSTAYNNDAANEGVGGGVYLAEGSTLKFDMGDNMSLGIYGNTANNAADDIYANGNATTLVLPKVSSMNLEGYHVQTGELYWVEDYVTDDSGYSSGTNLKEYYNDNERILRYRDAFRAQNMAAVRKIVFGASENSRTYTSKYVCLALGYDLYPVTIIKKGLKLGESAVFDIYHYNATTSGWSKYTTVALSCVTSASVGDGGVKAVMVLPAGTWKFVENTNWSWKYTLNENIVDAHGNIITVGAMNANGVPVTAAKLDEFSAAGKSRLFQYTFTNVSTGTDVKSDEDVKVNILNLNSTNNF